MSTTATTRILHAPSNTAISAQQHPWFWPLPRLDGIDPRIIGSAEQPTDGIEIGYQGRSSSPDLVPVFAVQDGIVLYAGRGANGATLCIDHPGGWSTQYAQLEHLLARPTDRFRRRRKERVRAGDVIGHARRSALRIRFALSQLTGDGCVVVDPATTIPTWSMLPWFTEPALRVVARVANGGASDVVPQA